MFYLTTWVDIFKFIEGLCVSLKLLSDPLCAEIAEFFLEIVTWLTTLLLLYLQFHLSHVILWMLC